MKRIFKTLTLLICLYMAVLSCGKDNSAKSSSSLVGTWKYSSTELLFNGKKQAEVRQPNSDWTITFTEDGTKIDIEKLHGETYPYTCKYKYLPGKKTLIEIGDDGEKEDEYYFELLSPTEFALSYGRDEHEIRDEESMELFGTYKGFKVYRWRYSNEYYYEYQKDGKRIYCEPLGDYDDSGEGNREYYDEEVDHYYRID